MYVCMLDHSIQLINFTNENQDLRFENSANSGIFWDLASSGSINVNRPVAELVKRSNYLKTIQHT